jgi:hypothetical protein
LATLKELQEYYSLEDVYLMYEASIVPKYNEFISSEIARTRATFAKGE